MLNVCSITMKIQRLTKIVAIVLVIVTLSLIVEIIVIIMIVIISVSEAIITFIAVVCALYLIRGLMRCIVSIFRYPRMTLYTLRPNTRFCYLVNLIENTFRREEAFYLACNEERAFFASEEHKKYDLWSCQKVTDVLIYLLDNIYISFGSKLYRQNVGIPMGTNCAPPPLLLICFCSVMRGTS